MRLNHRWEKCFTDDCGLVTLCICSGSPISRTRPRSCRRGSSRWGTRCPGLWTPQTSSRWVTNDYDDDDHSSLRSSLVWMSGVRAAAWAVREAARAVTARPWDRTIQVRDRYRSGQLMVNMQMLQDRQCMATETLFPLKLTTLTWRMTLYQGEPWVFYPRGLDCLQWHHNHVLWSRLLIGSEAGKTRK